MFSVCVVLALCLAVTLYVASQHPIPAEALSLSSGFLFASTLLQIGVWTRLGSQPTRTSSGIPWMNRAMPALSVALLLLCASSAGVRLLIAGAVTFAAVLAVAACGGVAVIVLVARARRTQTRA